MIKNLLLMAVFLTASLAFTTNKPATELLPTNNISEELAAPAAEPSAEEKISLLYEEFAVLNADLPSELSFTYALTGYNKLENQNKISNHLLTVVDFSLPSTQKRMWILNMETNKVLYHTYVSHGQNTGGNMATKFSNTVNSLQSSLGFYVTAETYYGKNGLSLFIDGMEKEFNSKARERYVVIHGADYAQENSIEKWGRLGRSYGCPAVPTQLSKEIINTIKGGSALFIYHPNKNYISKSTFLNA